MVKKYTPTLRVRFLGCVHIFCHWLTNHRFQHDQQFKKSKHTVFIQVTDKDCDDWTLWLPVLCWAWLCWSTHPQLIGCQYRSYTQTFPLHGAWLIPPTPVVLGSFFVHPLVLESSFPPLQVWPNHSCGPAPLPLTTKAPIPLPPHPTQPWLP